LEKEKPEDSSLLGRYAVSKYK